MAAATALCDAPADEVLVERLQHGDETAFNALYDRYFDRVYRFVARRLGNRADAEETVQEVFLNLFNSIHTFRGEAPFVAWIFGLTRRTIANRFKKKRHATVSLEAETDRGSAIGAIGSEASPIENYECRERVTQLENTAHSRLSPEQRLLFELHHLENRPISEIATSLKKSENSVKSSLYRARRILLER